MSLDTVIDLGKACGRELSQAEAARLREVGSRLHLREDDALWPLLAAMEYQRVYYEALPEKIAGASRAIMDGMAAAAEKETAAAQARLTASVVKEARNLASKIQYDSLVPMWLLALICLLAAVLHMPSGWLISGLCLAGGVFCGALTAKRFAEAKRGWWKNGGIAVLFIMLGTLLFSLSLSRLG